MSPRPLALNPNSNPNPETLNPEPRARRSNMKVRAQCPCHSANKPRNPILSLKAFVHPQSFTIASGLKPLRLSKAEVVR